MLRLVNKTVFAGIFTPTANVSVANNIFKTLKKPHYLGDKDELLKCTVNLELIATIDPPASDKAIKQMLALEMLQNKFSGTKTTNEEIKDLLISFINNLESKKITAGEKKLWKRVSNVINNLSRQLP